MTDHERECAAERLRCAHADRAALIRERNHWMRLAFAWAWAATIGWAAFVATVCWVLARGAP